MEYLVRKSLGFLDILYIIFFSSLKYVFKVRFWVSALAKWYPEDYTHK